MPVWTKQEILDCRELVLSNTPVDIVEDCYRRWGGNARHVLRDSEEWGPWKNFDTSMDQFSLKALVGE